MLSKTLETRHLNMIALGGSIGTGMFLTSGVAINQAGPGGALCAYLIISLMVFFLITSLGELSTHMPSTGSFCEYSGLYVNKSYGYAMSINYWFNWAITIAAEISAAVIVIKFWFPQGSDFFFSLIFFIAIVFLNLFSVRVYGEIEWLLSIIKVSIIVIFILLGAFLVFKQPNFGAHNFVLADAPFHNGLKGFFAVFLVAGFAFQGSELIGINSGETKNPSKSIPRAVKNVFWRLLMFYILGTLIISLLIPYTDLAVNGDIKTSPFTIVFSHYISNSLATNILNFVILIAILSAANASMYAATRSLWYMAHSSNAPAIFAKITNYGLPINALIATSLIGSSVFLSSFIGSGLLFNHLLNISSSCGFLAWFGIALSHFMFRRHFIKDVTTLKYRAIWFPFGTIFSMILIAIVILGQGYSLIGNYTNGGFIDAYGSLILFIFLMIYYKYFRKNIYKENKFKAKFDE
ncbi:MAG: amino acid permease [Burkholderiales bacterium]|nr:amino acid permease [Burkholderiales bacterium]